MITYFAWFVVSSVASGGRRAQMRKHDAPIGDVNQLLPRLGNVLFPVRLTEVMSHAMDETDSVEAT